VARLEFFPIPKGLEGKPYQWYRDWLEINFYEQLCSYCLLQFKQSLQIEHHEPQKYAPDRVNDPSNLLLGCSWCNSGKKDYHPNHTARNRLPRENRGFTVIDIRAEDFAEIFTLNPDGELSAKPGAQSERVKFNIVDLLRLNIKSYKKMRRRCLEYVETCENLLLLDNSNDEIKKVLEVIVRECAERYIFFKAFDVPLSEALTTLIATYIEQNRPQLMG
jgi:hypothetical protein